jgi:isopentenyl-diphosphate Delta-isomerase
MIQDYYKTKQKIAKLDKKGNTLGQIEKWEAHKKGVLHKAISVTLIYKNQYILQHRNHPAFNGVFDLTSSSHQLYINNKLQSSVDTAYECLKREWGVNKNDLAEDIKEVGEIYYKANDPNSIFKEHEVCVMIVAKLKKLPIPNFDYAYGYSLVSKKELADKKSLIYKTLAPWSKKALELNLI